MRSLITFGLLSACCLGLTSCAQQMGSNVVVVDETYVHRYGVEVPRQDWRERGQNGKVISTLANGVTVTKNYSAGVLEGDTCYTFPHNQSIERVETYQNNQRVKETSFYHAGAPRREIAYQPNGCKRIVKWYENGAPQSIEEYDVNGFLTQCEYHDFDHQSDSWVHNGEGMRVERDEYGQLVCRDTIQGGAMISRATYHPNGSPREITPYHDGNVEGLLKSYYPAGEPNTLEEWVGGKQQGVTTVYRNGEKYAEVPYVRGAKQGVERHYRDGTTVTEEISWKEGKLHGPYTKYVGDTVMTDWYYQGEPVTRGNFEILIRSPQG
ncbi:MAG: toxin-antitoxin system YwqK family antitoxin [Parachlamydiaceae bacterium]|nr:toxin-antitoxin system YwqK family antitoxin [Parachlamydiaceae bacterium]